jgi:hypothetical protein
MAEDLLRRWAGFDARNRVGSPPALPAPRVANHRGRVWEPFQGSHIGAPKGLVPVVNRA